MIARRWSGATRAADADDYLRYIQATGLADYSSTPGNQGVIVLRRRIAGRAEFLLISLWDSEEAVRRFAGEEVDRAVFYPEDDRYLVARDEQTAQYEIVYSTLKATGGEPGR